MVIKGNGAVMKTAVLFPGLSLAEGRGTESPSVGACQPAFLQRAWQTIGFILNAARLHFDIMQHIISY